MKFLSSLIILLLVFSQNAFAEITKQHNLLKDSTDVLEQILSIPDLEIPQRLTSQAKAILVFPAMLKAGFIGAVRYGKGVATVRHPETGKWGPPSFFTTLGGSVGFQAGAQAIDLVLLVMTERGVNGLLKNQFTLGSDLAVTAGPVGRHAEIGLDILLQGDVYSYSKSKGIFLGISLKGTVIKPHYELNNEYYRSELTPKEIMITKTLRRLPESSKRFMRDFNRMTPASKELYPGSMAKLDKYQSQSPLIQTVENPTSSYPSQEVKKTKPKKKSKPLW